MSATIVDWTALGKVVLYSLVAGVGVTGVFAIAVHGATRSSDMRRNSAAGLAGTGIDVRMREWYPKWASARGLGARIRRAGQPPA